MELTKAQRDTAHNITWQYLDTLRSAGIPVDSLYVKMIDSGEEEEARRYERLAETVSEREVAAIYKSRAKAIREGMDE